MVVTPGLHIYTRPEAWSAAQRFQEGWEPSGNSSTSLSTAEGSRTSQTASTCKRSNVRSVDSMTILSQRRSPMNVERQKILLRRNVSHQRPPIIEMNCQVDLPQFNGGNECEIYCMKL